MWLAAALPSNADCKPDIWAIVWVDGCSYPKSTHLVPLYPKYLLLAVLKYICPATGAEGAVAKFWILAFCNSFLFKLIN